MNVISSRGLKILLKGKSSDVAEETIIWYKRARVAEWRSLSDARATFPDADQVGSVLIFNIRGNRYRLIVTEMFAKNKVYVKALLRHKEYDRKAWMK